MLEVQSLRSLSHHRTPRLLDATHQLTTVLADFAKRGATRAPRCIRAAPKRDEGHIPPARSCARNSRRIREFVERGSDHPPTAGWMTVAER